VFPLFVSGSFAIWEVRSCVGSAIFVVRNDVEVVFVDGARRPTFNLRFWKSGTWVFWDFFFVVTIVGWVGKKWGGKGACGWVGDKINGGGGGKVGCCTSRDIRKQYMVITLMRFIYTSNNQLSWGEGALLTPNLGANPSTG